MRFSEFQRAQVITTDGVDLGRVMDFRCRAPATGGAAESSATVDAVLYGAPGLLERLGIRSTERCAISAQDVTQWDRSKLVVRAGGRRRKQRS
jgi:hypothetical protein